MKSALCRVESHKSNCRHPTGSYSLTPKFLEHVEHCLHLPYPTSSWGYKSHTVPPASKEMNLNITTPPPQRHALMPGSTRRRAGSLLPPPLPGSSVPRSRSIPQASLPPALCRHVCSPPNDLIWTGLSLPSQNKYSTSELAAIFKGLSWVPLNFHSALYPFCLLQNGSILYSQLWYIFYEPSE